jgi:predicted DNA-binding ribbon-helix-helix protein
VSLEMEFWDCLRDLANNKQTSLTRLVSEIDMRRDHGNLSSAIRLHVLRHFKERVTNA